MRAGKLDKTITIERPVRSLGPYGEQYTGWETVATMRTQIVNGSTEEFIRGQGATTETSITFRMRWLDGVTTEHRITYEGQAFDIKETKELGRRRGIDLRCVKVGP